jgi:hypothetical protein
VVAAANKRRGEADVRQYLAVACEGFDASPPADLDGTSAALLAAFDGLAVRALLDRDFDPVPAYEALERMIVAVLAPGSRPVEDGWDRDPYPEALPSPRREGKR